MRRAMIKISRKPTKNIPRVSRSEQYIVNLRYLGEEPVFAEEPSRVQIIQSFSWYTKMCTNEDARSYLMDFLSAKGRHDDIKKLALLPDQLLPFTACWVARMVMQNIKLDEDTLTDFEEMLDATFKRIKIEDKNTETNVISIQDRVRERTIDLIGEIESMIDSGEDFSLYEYLQRHQVPRVYTRAIIDKYADTVKELAEAFKGLDPQLVEAYNYMTKPELKARILFFAKIIEDANRYAQNVKTTSDAQKPRKQRIKRTPSLDKKMQYMKVQKESNEHKIASIGAEKIIGSTELWAFNTIYKSLTVLRAVDGKTLDVNRTNVVNVDDTKSQTKRIGRKTDAMLNLVLNSAKMQIKKEYDDINTSSILQTRMNENTILLRVFK